MSFFANHCRFASFVLLIPMFHCVGTSCAEQEAARQCQKDGMTLLNVYKMQTTFNVSSSTTFFLYKMDAKLNQYLTILFSIGVASIKWDPGFAFRVYFWFALLSILSIKWMPRSGKVNLWISISFYKMRTKLKQYISKYLSQSLWNETPRGLSSSCLMLFVK